MYSLQPFASMLLTSAEPLKFRTSASAAAGDGDEQSSRLATAAAINTLFIPTVLSWTSIRRYVECFAMRHAAGRGIPPHWFSLWYRPGLSRPDERRSRVTRFRRTLLATPR